MPTATPSTAARPAVKQGLVLAGGAVLTMDSSDRYLVTADIRIVDSKIDEIGATHTLAQPGDRSIDCTDTLVIPGLINTHTHACAGLFRGLPEDLPREYWRDAYGVQSGAFSNRGLPACRPGIVLGIPNERRHLYRRSLGQHGRNKRGSRSQWHSSDLPGPLPQ